MKHEHRLFGIYLPLLLLALYNNARQQGAAYDKMPAARFIGSRFKEGKLEIAEKLVEERLKVNNLHFNYIDLGAGERVIKVDIGRETPDFKEYDNHHGEGLSKLILDNLKSEHIKAYERSLDENPTTFAHMVLTYMKKQDKDEASVSGSKNTTKL